MAIGILVNKNPNHNIIGIGRFVKKKRVLEFKIKKKRKRNPNNRFA